MSAEQPDYHEVAASDYWTLEKIQERLGQTTLLLAQVDQPSGEYNALQKEIDVLAFELHMREAES